jgi:hypothetical protein
MVNINTVSSTSNSKTDVSNALLIIGKATTEYKNREIIKVNTSDDAEYLYGSDSDLTKAFKEARDVGVKNIYLCNCYLFTDYINVLMTIASTEFAYICPLFNFSETYVTNSYKEVYLCEMYSNIIGEKLTQLIFTDKHASLYENIEQYLKEMKVVYKRLKGDWIVESESPTGKIKENTIP